MDFRQDGFMMGLGAIVVAAILAESVVFLIRAIRRGRQIGMSRETIKNTVAGSALFTVAPALAVVATVLALSVALGITLPWIRLSVIGNISQETAAASAALDAMDGGSIANAVTDKHQFAVIMWVMTAASSLPLILLPLFLKKLQKTMKKAGDRDPKWVDAMSAAAFIGLISAFIARAIIGQGKQETFGDGAGVMSICTLIASVVSMLLLMRLSKVDKFRWLESFAMPIAMFIGMGVAVLVAAVLPPDIAYFEWRG